MPVLIRPATLTMILSVGVGAFAATLALANQKSHPDGDQQPFNVLFIISDDLTAKALSCYGNEVC